VVGACRTSPRRPGKMRRRPRTKSISERSRRGRDVSKDEGPLPKP
jgi:hypothetical protein